MKQPKFGALLGIAAKLDQRGEDPEESPIQAESPLPIQETPIPPQKPIPLPNNPAKVERKLVSTRLPVDLHKRLKRYSLESERDIEDILQEMLEDYLSLKGF